MQKHCWHRVGREGRRTLCTITDMHISTHITTFQESMPKGSPQTRGSGHRIGLSIQKSLDAAVYPVFSESECFPYKQCTMYSPNPLQVNVLFFFVSLVSFFLFFRLNLTI